MTPRAPRPLATPTKSEAPSPPPPAQGIVRRFATRNHAERARFAGTRGSSGFFTLLHAWGELKSIPRSEASRAFRKEWLAAEAFKVADQAKLLKEFLVAAGVNVVALISGRPLAAARPMTPVAPKPPARPPVKTPADLAVTTFNEYVSLRAAGNWSAICLFHKANFEQIEAGRAAMLADIDQALARAPEQDRAEISQYRSEVQKI